MYEYITTTYYTTQDSVLTDWDRYRYMWRWGFSSVENERMYGTYTRPPSTAFSEIERTFYMRGYLAGLGL